eukprot:370348_1
METKYYSLEISAKERNGNDFIIRPEFAWLSKLVLLTPMWCPIEPNQQRRSTCITILMLIITISGSLYYVIYWSWLSYHLYWPHEFMVVIVGAFESVTEMISKLVSMYHFYF